MPEVWFPYGSVETLVTIQAENLGAMIEPAPERSSGETDGLAELLRGAATLFVCDSNPATAELLREVAGGVGAADSLKVVAEAPKRIESLIPEFKGKVQQAPKGQAPESPPAVGWTGRKAFVATARPDPLFGIVDTKVQACLNWVQGAQREAAGARRDFEPTPFEKTAAYEKAEDLAGSFGEATFFTVVPRGGKVRSVLEDAPFDAVRNCFLDSEIPQARGIIAGAGGRGYDDTFSTALRSIWGVLPGVRKAGEILMISECSGGLGSSALEMLAAGRIGGDGGTRKEKYVDGLEEVYYLDRLKEEYDVILLSGLPELFAKNKLGLTTARGSGEAVGRLLNKLGRSAKVNVVTRAPECRLGST